MIPQIDNRCEPLYPAAQLEGEPNLNFPYSREAGIVHALNTNKCKFPISWSPLVRLPDLCLSLASRGRYLWQPTLTTDPTSPQTDNTVQGQWQQGSTAQCLLGPCPSTQTLTEWAEGAQACLTLIRADMARKSRLGTLSQDPRPCWQRSTQSRLKGN